MEISELKDRIEKAGSSFHCFGNVSSEQIASAETLLNCKLPPSYKSFIETYGAISACGIDIAGLLPGQLNKKSIYNIIHCANKLKEYELSDGMLPIHKLGDGNYACITCVTTGNSERQVILWDIAQSKQEISEALVLASNFSEYISNLFDNEIFLSTS